MRSDTRENNLNIEDRVAFGEIKYQITNHKAYLINKLADINTDLKIIDSELKIKLDQFEAALKNKLLTKKEIRVLHQLAVLNEMEDILNEKPTNETNIEVLQKEQLSRVHQVFQEHHATFTHRYSRKKAAGLIAGGPIALAAAIAIDHTRAKKSANVDFVTEMKKQFKSVQKSISDVDITQVKNARSIRNGDELRNVNSYEYLKNIYETIKDEIDNEQYSTFYSLQLLNLWQMTDYRADYPYGDLYTQFLTHFENEISEWTKERQQLISLYNQYKDKELIDNDNFTNQLASILDRDSFENYLRLTNNQESSGKIHEVLKNLIINHPLNKLQPVITTIYKNENKALERTAEMIKPVLQGKNAHTSSQIQSDVRARMMSSRASRWNMIKSKVNIYQTSIGQINKISPQQTGSNLMLFIGIMSRNFKPQTTTSMASVVHYKYKDELAERKLPNVPEEYRMGTQGQRHLDNKFSLKNSDLERASLNFEALLQQQFVNRMTNPPQDNEHKTRITHVYINHLGYDRSGLEGDKEKGLSQSLHGLEDKYDNIAVITLPADKGLLDHHLLTHHEKNINAQDAFKNMLSSATTESTRYSDGTTSKSDDRKVNDFAISEDIKKLLYGEKGSSYNTENEQKIIADLLHKSFTALGIPETGEISEAERTAVYFHFVKYEMTNFILTTLNPDSFNISCKDAIDRARVSSGYFNLMKSFEATENSLTPMMSKDEFYLALHSAAAMVKGRAINHHSQLIWNTIDAYVNRNQNNPNKSCPDWLVEWRDNNAPKNSKLYLLREVSAYRDKLTKKEDSQQSSLFSKNKSYQTEREALTSIIDWIKNGKNPDFTQAQINSLMKGDLGKLTNKLEKHGLLNKEMLTPRIDDTKKDRPAFR